MSDKLTTDHLRRKAVVYVRQSSLHQVKNNRESRRRQYELKEHALGLGFANVEVIDEDLGLSGGGKVDRPGFGRLLELVCRGEVGAVMAFEASRLARNNRDWHHLVDLCAMTDTLVVDHDGVYNARLLNDRLLLGLKGTMSEFELGLLRQRAQEALRQKIARGEVLTMVPVGYERTEDNGMAMTADMQVRQAIAGVFERFRQCGSARQVLLWYRQEEIPLPTLARKGGRELVWRLPVFNRIVSLLKNPAYAGAFVYGKTCSRTSMEDGRARTTRGHARAPEDWQVMILDHHPGYIDWQQYCDNRKVLWNNRAMKGKMRSAVRRGPALLGGLLRCGHCGRALHVAYSGNHGRVARYHCKGAHINHGTDLCISVGALRMDEKVSEAVIEALRPAGVEASLQAAEQAKTDQATKKEALSLALEKARYEADRARRQYDRVEPENRLVAMELERRWNEALRRIEESERRLAEEPPPEAALNPGEHQLLKELGRDLEGVWQDSNGPMQLKKRIVRTLLEEIIVSIVGEPISPQVELVLHWAGGVHTRLRFHKNRTGMHRHQTSGDVVDLVSRLTHHCDDGAIASILNRNGYRTGTGKRWTASRVAYLRHHRGIQSFYDPKTRSWLTLDQTSEHLGVSRLTVRKLIGSGVLPAQHSARNAPWIILPESLKLPAVVQTVETLKKTGKLHLPQTTGNVVEFSFVTDNMSKVE